MSSTTYDSLEAAEARMRELRGEFLSIREADRTAPDFAETRKALLDEVHEVDAVLTTFRADEMRNAARSGPMAAMLQVGGERRSIGDALFASPEFRAWADAGANGQSPPVQTYREFRDIFEYTTNGPENVTTDGVTHWLPAGQPTPPRPRRGRMVLRDLLNIQRTTLPTIPYIRELNPTSLEGGASAVKEGAAKPDAGVSFEEANAPVTTIAANVTVSRQLFDDAQAVIQYVNNRLPYLVRIREDAELLNGNGTWPNITGIRVVSGTQTQAATSGETAITIGNSMALVEIADGDATAVIMHPTDAWAMFTKRAAAGAGTFDAGDPFGRTALTVWGRPVLSTRFQAAGEALVGDWPMAATLWDRQDINVVAYPSHSDYPIKNKILIQAEERVALSIERPDLIVKATIS